MDGSKETLKDLELFRSFSAEEIDTVSKECKWRLFHPNELIVGQEDETRDVFFIVRGKVRVTVYAASGKEVSFRDLGVGQMFGELSAIDGRPRSATVVAIEDSCMARMPQSIFRAMLERYPPFSAAVLHWLVCLVRALSDRVFEFSTLAVKNRIHAELLRLARDEGLRNGTTVIIPAAPTHAEIASRISTHREAVTREMNELAHAGLLERGRGGLIIRDVDRLARLVDEVNASL